MARKITEDDWSRHQATIEQLYLTENRKLQGPGSVMEEMSKRLGFEAS
jgi:Clr5 domain